MNFDLVLSQFLNMEVASRFLRLFLPSHALILFYLFITILTLDDNRKEFFDAIEYSKLHMVLKELIMKMIASLDGTFFSWVLLVFDHFACYPKITIT